MASNIDRIKENIRINIRKYRKKRGLTQLQLGVQADVTEGHIRALEAGRKKPGLDVLCKIADVLEIDVRLLFE